MNGKTGVQTPSVKPRATVLQDGYNEMTCPKKTSVDPKQRLSRVHERENDSTHSRVISESTSRVKKETEHTMRDRRKEDCKGLGKEFKEARVANLRKMKIRQSPLPNLKAKLWATRILDEINNDCCFLSRKHPRRQ